jgi:hypothetical protein
MAKGKDVGCGHDKVVTRLVEYTGRAMRDRMGVLAWKKRVSATQNARENKAPTPRKESTTSRSTFSVTGLYCRPERNSAIQDRI